MVSAQCLNAQYATVTYVIFKENKRILCQGTDIRAIQDRSLQRSGGSQGAGLILFLTFLHT